MSAQKGNLSQPLREPQAVKYKDHSHILKVVINVCLASTYSGFILAYLNTISFDDTVRIFDIKQDRALMQGLLSFCIAIGAGVGGYLSSYMLSNFARRQCFLLIAYASIVATLLLQSKVIEIIFICRLAQGISVGMTSALRPIYIKQFVPIEMAGQMGSLNQLMFAVGLIFTFVQTYILSLFLSPQAYWRIVYLTPVVFLAIQVYNFRVNFAYETPKYLVEQGRRQQAYALVRLIYKPEYVEERMVEMDKIIKLTQQDSGEESKHVEMQQMQLMQEMNAKTQKVVIRKGKSNSTAIWAALHLSVLQQITGIQIIIIYAGEILLRIAPSFEKVLPILLQIQGFIFTLYSMKLLGSYGRKQMIQKGLIVMAVIQLSICLGFFWKGVLERESGTVAWLPSAVIIFGLCSMRAMFSLTIGPIVWLYLPEIVQPDIISIATMVNWFTAAFVSFIFPICVEFFGGPEQVFGMIAVLIMIGYVVNEQLMVETKDRAQWQIREQYDAIFQKKK